MSNTTEWIPDWNVIPVGGVVFGALKLQRAMNAAAPPGCLTWSIDGDGKYDRRHMTSRNLDCGHWPVPVQKGYVCVFDPDNPEYLAKYATGFGWTTERYASCTYRSGIDTDLVMGLRIWHEVLHCILGSAEPDDMTRSPGFIEYLVDRYGDHDPFVTRFRDDVIQYEHDPEYQKEFYTYLMVKHFPDEVAGRVPPVSLKRRIAGLIQIVVGMVRRFINSV